MNDRSIFIFFLLFLADVVQSIPDLSVRTSADKKKTESTTNAGISVGFTRIENAPKVMVFILQSSV